MPTTTTTVVAATSPRPLEAAEASVKNNKVEAEANNNESDSAKDQISDQIRRTSPASATNLQSPPEASVIGVSDDLGSSDEVKVFRDEDERDGDASESYQAELQAEKSSLIHESEQVQSCNLYELEPKIIGIIRFFSRTSISVYYNWQIQKCTTRSLILFLYIFQAKTQCGDKDLIFRHEDFGPAALAAGTLLKGKYFQIVFKLVWSSVLAMFFQDFQLLCTY